MNLSNRQKAILHVAKGKLGLTDAEYRAALVHIAGVTSATGLDRDGFEALMGFFEWMGVAPPEPIRTLRGEWTGAGGTAVGRSPPRRISGDPRCFLPREVRNGPAGTRPPENQSRRS